MTKLADDLGPGMSQHDTYDTEVQTTIDNLNATAAGLATQVANLQKQLADCQAGV